MTTDSDLELAVKVLRRFPQGFVGGSYVVDQTTANDIDVLVAAHGQPQADAIASILADEFSFVHEESTKDTDDKYAGEEEYMFGHLRNAGVNVILLNVAYVSAYYAATLEMHRSPESYDTREKRCELHARFRDTVTEMLA